LFPGRLENRDRGPISARSRSDGFGPTISGSADRRRYHHRDRGAANKTVALSTLFSSSVLKAEF
jgi:hypothetical protein